MAEKKAVADDDLKRGYSPQTDSGNKDQQQESQQNNEGSKEGNQGGESGDASGSNQ
jgi:hypothetical protein